MRFSAKRMRVVGLAALSSIVAVGCSGGGAGGAGGPGGPGGGPGEEGDVVTANPILFVTQVPIPSAGDFRTVVSTFANHEGRTKSCGRGGDLYIRYPDGELRNLTQEAGYGVEGLQVGPNAIAVREPAVHWNGQKAVFSMVVGGPMLNDETSIYYWQLYEVTGLGRNDTAVITKVPHQPANRNNVGPCYTSDGRILFVSDRTRSGQPHLYPQLDEYEEIPTNTGIWSLDPATGDLFQMNHSPSGSFRPFVDSFGRVVFTRWDHLERDQQKDRENMGVEFMGTFNWSDESPGSFDTGSNEEYFPEGRKDWVYFVNNNPGYMGDLNGWAPNITGNTFNLFFPWTLNQDGTEEETLNHVGRQELRPYLTERAFTDDPNLFSGFPMPGVANSNFIGNVLHIREDPTEPGSYFCIDAPEFFTYSSGMIFKLTGGPNLNANEMEVTYWTNPETGGPSNNPSPAHSGLYRTPLPLSDGQLLASHTFNTVSSLNGGVFDFRLRLVESTGGFPRATKSLTTGIVKSVTYNDPYYAVEYDGPMWELDPVEVFARPVPPMTTEDGLEAPEMDALVQAGVNEGNLRDWLRANDLALIVSRNVTKRDGNDVQQPFNLRVPGGNSSIPTGGQIYDIQYFQMFQADQIRGITGGGTQPIPGRRPLAVPLHDTTALMPALDPGDPEGSVELGDDGSMAALVPARRAMSWQLTDPDGDAVVRERYWVTFQPGEIRSCNSCHGINELSQTGNPPPSNMPKALRDLLLHLRGIGELP